MSFLEPLFLIGLLGAGLPLLVHMINRRKATRRSFPALAFLIESNKRVARSIKIRQWALMALRVLAVVLLAIAMAKPFVLSSRGVTAGERMPTAVAIVVDTSASMTHGDWWARAEEELDRELDGLRPWDEVALVTTTQREIPERLTDNHGRVRRAADALTPRAREGDLARALQSAADVLSTSQLPNRKIVLVTDLSASAIAAHREPPRVPYPIELRLVRGEREGAPKNLAVTNVSYRQEGSDENGWRIEATVKNLSARAVSDVDLSLEIDNTPISVGRVASIEPDTEVVHIFRHRQSTPGTFPATVKLSGEDDYPLDDRFSFVFRTRSKTAMLLVNGEPASVAYDDELFFITRALNPKKLEDSGLIPTAITPEGLADRDLEDYDVVVLANVSRVPAAMANKLERYVRGGGGLLITSGDQIDVEAYNQTLAALLPKPMRGLKELAQRDDPDAPVKITRLGASNHKHPIFRAFTSVGGSTLQSAQVYSYMLLEPGDPALSTTLLSYKDNAPALIEREVGRGRVLLLTTSIDFEWSDLPIRSVFLPLVQRTAQYLARRATSTGEVRHLVGTPLELQVSGLIDDRAIIKGPMEDKKPARHVLEPLDGVLSFEPAEVGVYTVWAEDDQSTSQRLDGLAFAVNVSPGESSLAAMSEEDFEGWLGQETPEGKARLAKSSRARERRVNIWPTLLFLVTLALLAETILGTRRSVLMRLWRIITRRPLEA